MEAKNAFFDEIYKLLPEEKDVLILSVDAAGPPFDKIREEFPNQYISVGIAEQNGIQIACGLAMSGHKVIVYGVDPFITGRAYDQIRNCVGLMRVPITIAAANAGIQSDCGITHAGMEEITTMTTLPGVTTILVSDNAMARLAAHEAIHKPQPRYIRFDAFSADVLPGELIDFTKGFRVIEESGDIAIISCGCSHENLMKFDFEEIMARPAIIDLFAYPFDERALIHALSKYRALITYEEHILRGGLGSIVLETLNKHNIALPVRRMGIDLGEGYPQTYGGREYRLKEFGLTGGAVLEVIKNFR